MSTGRRFPAPRRVDTNGIAMAVHLCGPEDGFPVLLCHGWPELAYSWRHQLEALGDAGFRAIAPDLRGYGHTGGPKGPEAVPLYDMEHLTADLIGLLDALGIDHCVVAGHDWGGMLAWQLPLFHAERVAGVIGVNTPFLPRTATDPVESLRALFGDSMYVVRFQVFGEAERILERDTRRSLRFFLRRSSHTQKSWSERPAAKRSLAFLDALQRPETQWGGSALLTPEELGVYYEGYERSGWEGGINWYRNLSRNWRRAESLEQRIDVPSLLVCGANDVVLPPSLGDGMEAHVPDLERIVLDCGHWTQAEKPRELNAAMLDWLERRFR